MSQVKRPPLVGLGPELAIALRHGTVLTSTRRLAREISYAVDYQATDTTRQTWPTPDALSLNAFLERCYRDCQDAGVPGAEPLLLADDILPFAIARAVPNPSWLRHVDTFAQAWRLAHLYGIASADPRLADTENGRAYSRWAVAFERLAELEGWITSPELPDRLIKLIDGTGRWQPPPATALELDDVPPAMQRFLAASRTPSLVLPAGPPAATMRLLPLASRPRVQPTANAQAVEELAVAAAWTRECLARQPAGRIGVVVAGLGSAFGTIERRFNAAFADISEPANQVNVSGGIPLAQEPVCRDALELLAFTADGLDHEGLRALSASPFLELTLPRRLPRRAALRDLLEAPGLGRLRNAHDAAQQTRSGAKAARRILDAAGWASGGLDSQEIQAKRQFEQCLTDFAFAHNVGAIQTWHVAVGGLKQLAGSRLFAPQGGDAPIQILGRAESIGLTFDHLWLAGMHHGGWPPVPEPNPLLPLAVQRTAGVPSLALDQELARARRMTERWRRSARHLVASYATEAQSDAAPVQPSRLVRDFEPAAVDDVLDQPSLATNGHPWAQVHRLSLVEYIDEWAGPAPQSDSETQPGGAAVVQDQSLCPFRAWARHRLGLQEGTLRDRFPNEAERGAIMHNVLAELARRHPQRDRLANVPPDEVAGVVDSAMPRGNWPSHYREREAKRLQNLVVEWLGKESARPPFSVVLVEEPHTIDIGGLRLSLRIDRIDEVAADPDGRRGNLLIDFKTGQVSIYRWLGARPEDPQLPLYALASKQSVHGVAYAQIRLGESRLTGVVDPTAIAGRFASAEHFAGKSFDELLVDWRTALTALAEQFQTGFAAVDPSRPAVCRRCHLHALCRVFA